MFGTVLSCKIIRGKEPLFRIYYFVLPGQDTLNDMRDAVMLAAEEQGAVTDKINANVIRINQDGQKASGTSENVDKANHIYCKWLSRWARPSVSLVC